MRKAFELINFRAHKQQYKYLLFSLTLKALCVFGNFDVIEKYNQSKLHKDINKGFNLFVNVTHHKCSNYFSRSKKKKKNISFICKCIKFCFSMLSILQFLVHYSKILYNSLRQGGNTLISCLEYDSTTFLYTRVFRKLIYFTFCSVE